MRKNIHFKSGLVLTAENIILGGIKFIFSILLVKKFGSSCQGEYAYLNTIASYFVIFSISLVDQTNIVRVSKIKNLISNLQEYIGTACIISGLMIISSSLLLYSLFKIGVLNSIGIPIAYIISYSVLFAVRQIFRSMILATEKYLLHSITNITIEFSLLALLFFTTNFNDYIFYSFFLISITAFIFIITIFRKVNFKVNYSKEEFNSIFLYGSKMLGFVIMQTILLRIDVFFIMYFYNAKLLSFYIISTTFAELINLPSKSITSIILNKTIHNENSIKVETFRLLNTLNWIIFFGILIIGSVFIPIIYGKEYGNYIHIFLIQSIGALIISYTYIYSYYMIGKSKQKSILNSYIFSTILSIIMYYLLTKYFSITGTSIASTLSYLSIMFFMYYYLKKNDILFRNFKILLPTIETFHFIKNKIKR
jgi:O-antigen/teichoic acid export membrane protein